jgi:prepilin-type N-terminal cleavage/methylation domain-containing protein
MKRHHPQSSAGSRSGFTLLELLIVIGIIVIVASLVLAVSSSVARASEERSTKNTLEVLNMAVEEYERTVDRRVSYRSGVVTGGIIADATSAGGVAFKFDVDSGAATPPAGSGVTAWNALQNPYNTVAGGLPAYSNLPFRRTAILIQAMTDAQSCAAIMQKLPEAIFRGIKANTAQGNFTAARHCIDAWDTPIIAVFPGREASQAELTANNPNIVDRTAPCAATASGPYLPRAACRCRARTDASSSSPQATTRASPSRSARPSSRATTTSTATSRKAKRKPLLKASS